MRTVSHPFDSVWDGMRYIYGATLYTPESILEDAAVLIDEGRIIAVDTASALPCPAGADTLDATGLLLAPGFIELQLNGGFGDDFTDDPTTIWRVAELLPRYGVTSFLPTIITAPPEKVALGQQVVTAGRPAGFRGAAPLGLHVEGPFLNPQKKGAHNPAYLRPPSLDAVADWSPEIGVRLVSLAPELPGALDVIRALAGRGVLVGAAHSMATYDEAVAGFDAGIRYGTHLFNAMPALGHRDPGLPAALLADDRVTVGIIADGIHVHPALVKLVWRMLGPGRLNLVTDAMAALGMARNVQPGGRPSLLRPRASPDVQPDGHRSLLRPGTSSDGRRSLLRPGTSPDVQPDGHRSLLRPGASPDVHRLGDFEVTVDATGARLADGTLAGSILSLDQALRNLIAFTGCTLNDALATVTTTPAKALGLDRERGRIAPGYAADLVLLTPDLRVRATVVAGEVVYTAPED